MSDIIAVKNFTKKYGNYTAVNDVTFSVKKGDIFAFLGPNGAGKSTTINTLCTIFEKTLGTLTIDGKDVTTQKDEVRKTIGIVFQESTLDNKMTVEENLKMHCIFYKVPKEEIDERIGFVLSLVDLLEWQKSPVSSLSGGMKRRVEIARSLIHYPKVLFLDEPTTGLDPQTRANMWEYILKLQKEKNITIFLTTHYMDEAEVCHKIAIMDEGKIIENDTPYNLKKKYTKDTANISTMDETALERLLTENNLTYKKKNDYISVDVKNLPNFLNVISIEKNNITDLEIKKGTLNDVFLEITGKDIRDGVK